MTKQATDPLRCWAALDDGRWVMAQCVPETLDGGYTGYMVTIDRYDLPPDEVQAWDKGTGGRFQSIGGFFGKSQVSFEDPPIGPHRDFSR